MVKAERRNKHVNCFVILQCVLKTKHLNREYPWTYVKKSPVVRVTYYTPTSKGTTNLLFVMQSRQDKNNALNQLHIIIPRVAKFSLQEICLAIFPACYIFCDCRPGLFWTWWVVHTIYHQSCMTRTHLLFATFTSFINEVKMRSRCQMKVMLCILCIMFLNFIGTKYVVQFGQIDGWTCGLSLGYSSHPH